MRPSDTSAQASIAVHAGPGGSHCGSALRVTGLYKTYQTRAGDVEALRDVSFAAASAEFVSLVGPSGCGKSTVLKILAGLEQYDTGVVEVEGRPPVAGRQDCGIMLQRPVLLPWRTVVENLLLPLETFGLRKVFSMNRRQAVERANEILDVVNLSEFGDKYPWELSGGMQQRVSLARLLMVEPDVLLMDEPFGALDEFTRERLNFEVARLHEKTRKLVIFVTHNIHEAVILSDKVVVMKADPGEVVETFDVDLPRPRSSKTLEDPQAAELMNHIRVSLVESFRDWDMR